MPLDMGVGTAVVLPFFPRPHLLCSETLRAFPGGTQSPRRKSVLFQSCRPTLTFSPRDCYHLSVQRLGLVPVPISMNLAQCWW